MPDDDKWLGPFSTAFLAVVAIGHVFALIFLPDVIAWVDALFRAST